MLSCSQFSSDKNSEVPIVEPIPQWLKVDPRFAHRSTEGFYTTHAFFDFIPFPDLKTNKINFVLLTPEDSEFGYELNLHSGQIVKRHKYCPQDDIWRAYKSELNRPPYSYGFVPRILDQLGSPLKIFVFGGKKYLSKSTPSQPLSQRVRVVGGIIHQYCENFPCARRSEWLSRLVLLGVNHLDPKFKKVATIKALKSEIDWKEFKAFVENGFGRQIRGKDESPAFRVFGAVNAKEAFRYALSKGHLFKFKEMKKLREGCHRLYDYVWKRANLLRTNIAKKRYRQSTVGDVDNRSLLVDVKKSIFLNKDGKKKEFTKEELEEPMVGPKTFLQFFNEFYNKYSERFQTCSEFVRSSNALKDKERHWFFAYLQAFLNLEDLGYVYHCSKRVWIRNSFLADGTRQYDKKAMKNSCISAQLEQSFDMAITLLGGLKRGNYPHFYYLLYDQGHGGSHNRIFSWVESDGKQISCKEKVVDYRNEEFFPKDVSWNYFNPDNRR